MNLRQLTLDNFGPYRGRHDIDLRVSPSAPIVLIHGENERGKTSFANALRWCLYKKALEPDGTPLDTYQLINWEALDSGDYHMAVTLEFEHRGEVYLLERQVQSRIRPTSDQDLQWSESLRKNGHFEPRATIDRTIRDILHVEISRFFLFDGEMLNHYRVLLGDPTRNALLVRQSIEQILGLPALQGAVGSLEGLRRGAEQRQLQEARARRANERLVADAQQKQDSLDALERDITHYRDLQSRLESEREVLKERRERFVEIEGDLRRLTELEEAKRQIDDAVSGDRKAIQALLRDAWWMPLEARLHSEAEHAQALAAQAADQSREAERRHLELALLESATSTHKCGVCYHLLSDSELAGLQERLAAVQRQIAAAGPPSPVSAHIERLGLLRQFEHGGYRSLREREMRLRRLSLDRGRLDSEEREIKERVQADHRGEIADVERDYDRSVAQLATVGDELEGLLQRQRETSAALQRLQAQIRGLPEANKKLAAEASLYGALRSLFEVAVSRFRDRLREEVEAQATDIHKSLTTEPGYVRLTINDQYGLTIINDEGREIRRPSAGSSQVVALSLIAALSRCATREGPIVMDTPFGRLDRGHRKKILQYAPRLASQVILLVQSGELERDRDLGEIAPYVSREYSISRDGASDRSKITIL
jgi:DNA sulfur modification protein DndD